MKVLTVVGARPQFIKAAVVSHELRKRHTEILVHTGQHFDYNMSGQFFEELDIPEPDHNLGISGGSHAEMTGMRMIGTEEVLLNEKPDWLLVYGDTNSTRAVALAAAKPHIPICHVEAGTRTHSMKNPEEINRICTVYVSPLLLSSTQSGMEAIEKEGLSDRGYMAGDPMYDAFIEYSRKKKIEQMQLKTLDGDTAEVPAEYYYLTCHREENPKGNKDLTEISTAIECLDAPVVYPVHPRNKQMAVRIKKEQGFRNLILPELVEYLESICLINHAKNSDGFGRTPAGGFFRRKEMRDDT